VKFHNGEPVTAADVSSRSSVQGAGVKLLKERVREGPDRGPRQDSASCSRSLARFHDVLRDVGHWRRMDRAEAYVERWARTASAGAHRGGPYKFVSFNPGVELVMEALDGYWRKVPNVKRLGSPQHARRNHARRRAQEGRGDIPIC